MHKIKEKLLENSVIILFLALGIGGFLISGLSLEFVLDELVARVARNSFLVLALIIPVVAGMGLNFGIVMGAMAGQIGIIMVTDWGIVGVPGFLLAGLISVPFAILFGYLIGLLLNKTKGQEMITGMMAGYFSSGLYELVFLFLVGPIIPIMTKTLLVSNGVGLKNTVDLQGGIRNSLDGIWKISLYEALMIGLIAAFIIQIIIIVVKKVKGLEIQNKKYIRLAMYIVGLGICQLGSIKPALEYALFPVVTMCVIGLLCLFNIFILNTKLGQDFKTVGRSRQVANASGIDVDKVRIKAIILSTVLAAWGQLIFLQNIGTLNTYGSHKQVGLFASASILIGGATITKATNTQAILGVILFHLLFIVSPQAGQQLFDNAQIGEFFRTFIAYAVICVSIALYAWKNNLKKQKEV